MVVVARVCRPDLVRLEIPELHRLADRSGIAAASHIAVPKTDGRRTAILRGNPATAVDDVVFVFRADRTIDRRNATRLERSAAPGTAGTSPSGRHRRPVGSRIEG